MMVYMIAFFIKCTYARIYGMKKGESVNNLNRDSGKHKNTFVVKIEHSQNETWQGKVIWAEESRPERFRSALELIRLMKEAMAGEKQQTIEQERTGS